MGYIMPNFLGYKIFDTLEDFYAWQGINGNPAENTVNNILGYGDYSSTKRYTYPNPHNTANYDFDDNDMPINITGNDIRVCCLIDDNCPESLLPTDLLSLEDVQAQGWFNEDLNE